MMQAGEVENLLAVIEWCRAERERLDGQRKALTGARIATGENDGNGWVDTSLRDLLRVMDSIAELDILLGDNGGLPDPNH
jgi:hypothetical protein